MTVALDQLLRNNRLVWRGRGGGPGGGRVLATGFPALSAILPEGGWPGDALLEICVPQWGVGELQLLLPAMVEASRAGRWLVWVAPPYLPYAPALAASGIDLSRMLLLRPQREQDVAWAMEQVLRQRRCAMVLAWPGRLKPVTARRLQLAAEAGRSLGVLFQRQAGGVSVAALRLKLARISHRCSQQEGGEKCGRVPCGDAVQVEILKSRAACRRRSVELVLE